MEDRELLVFAGKAVGYEVKFSVGGGSWVSTADSLTQSFNPLANAADAFNLASRLGLVVDFRSSLVGVELEDGYAEYYAGPQGDDMQRCIAVAAADVGRAMP